MEEERDVTGLCRIKDGFAYVADDYFITNGNTFKIPLDRFQKSLRYEFCDKDRDWKGKNADVILEELYEQELKEADNFIKRLKKFCNCGKNNYGSIRFLFLEYILKARITEEYESICRIMENSPDSDVIDGVEWFDWIVHEIRHPGESIPDWKEREKREEKEMQERFNKLFGKPENNS